MHPITESKDTFARLNAAATGNVLTFQGQNVKIVAPADTQTERTLDAAAQIIPINQTIKVIGTVSPEKIMLAEWATRFDAAIKQGRLCIADADGTFAEFSELMNRTNELCKGLTVTVGE